MDPMETKGENLHNPEEIPVRRVQEDVSEHCEQQKGIKFCEEESVNLSDGIPVRGHLRAVCTVIASRNGSYSIAILLALLALAQVMAPMTMTFVWTVGHSWVVQPHVFSIIGAPISARKSVLVSIVFSAASLLAWHLSAMGGQDVFAKGSGREWEENRAEALVNINLGADATGPGLEQALAHPARVAASTGCIICADEVRNLLPTAMGSKGALRRQTSTTIPRTAMMISTLSRESWPSVKTKKGEGTS
jgi:hypothetical protein